MSALDSLIQLHETNERLKEIQELKGNLPEVLNKLKFELEEINKVQIQNKVELEDLNGKIISHNATLTDSNDKLKKYNDQLFNVTNTKEYEALILETDQLKDVVLSVNEEFNSNPFEVPPEQIVSSRIGVVTTGISFKTNINTSLSEPPQSPSTCRVIV